MREYGRARHGTFKAEKTSKNFVNHTPPILNHSVNLHKTWYKKSEHCVIRPKTGTTPKKFYVENFYIILSHLHKKHSICHKRAPKALTLYI